MLSVAQFLPDIALPSVPARTPTPLRPNIGRTTVLVSIHAAACQDCRRYLEELAGSSSEFYLWDARLLIVVPGIAAQLRPGFGQVLADEAGQIAAPGQAAVLVADRYGQIFDAVYAGAGHNLPAPRQLEEWLKFLGTLCPE